MDDVQSIETIETPYEGSFLTAQLLEQDGIGCWLYGFW